jgi:hypothetical protein
VDHGMLIMLPTNFDILASENSDLRPVLVKLKTWVEKHSNSKILDPRIVARDLRDVDPYLLSRVLVGLVNMGLYRRVYMVQTPSGSLADGEYDDPRKVPERVADNFMHYFDPTETDIVPIYKPVK